MSKKKDLVTIVCYGSKEVVERKKAMDNYFEAMCCCEGAERERYTNIYCRLKCGETYIDGDEY